MPVSYRVGPRGRIRVGGTNLYPGDPIPSEEVATWHRLDAYIANGQVEVVVDGDEEETTRQEWLAQRNAASRGQAQVAEVATSSEAVVEEEPVAEEPEEVFSCDQCDFETTSKRGLSIHQTSQHAEDDESPPEDDEDD